MKKNFFINGLNFVVIILVFCGVYFCPAGSLVYASPAGDVSNPPQEKPATYWEPSAPEEQGIDSTLLLQMLEKIQKEEMNIRSLIIVRNQRLVLESYIYPYTRDIPHNTKSASKSIISALTGIALQKKWLESPDETIKRFFPQYLTGPGGTGKDSITLRHLLTMSTGLKIEEQSQDTEKIFSSPDPVKTTFSFPLSGGPGKKFNYLTPITLVMSVILTKTSGKSLQELADNYLFGPLGIEPVAWKEIPPGYYFTDAALRPLDMAKFGQLFLDKGKWEGKQVIPASWVEESTQKHIKAGETFADAYGYFWWINTSKTMFMALGWGGQGIFIIPEKNMVIVTTAASLGASLKMVFDFIIPAVKSSNPLLPNPQSVEALRHISDCLQFPTAADRQAVLEPPELIKEINGRIYNLEPNIAGLVSMTFQFTKDSCRLTLGTEKDTSELEVGLDNVYRISDSGRYGERPGHNKMALKGKWKNNNTFFLVFHSIGRPEQALMDIQFNGADITISVEVVGTDMKFPINGRAENPIPCD